MKLTITSLPQPKWVKIEFSELYKGYNSVNVRAEQLNGIWCGATMLGVSITDGKLWDLSFDDVDGAHKVLSVNGDAPTSNDELCTMIMGLNIT